MTMLTLLLLVAFVALGRWQWGRAEAKRALWDAFARGSDAAMQLDARPLADWPRFSHVKATGRWHGEHQFLLDNRIVDGAPGFEALTPFELTDGRWLLVDRGWLKFNGHREQLPDIGLHASAAETILVGRLDQLPSAGLASGRAAPVATGSWPRLTTYPRSTELSAALGVSLQNRILLLDSAESDGYVRHWSAPGVPPNTHWSYAIQWWCFALVLLVLYVVLNTHKHADDTKPDHAKS